MVTVTTCIIGAFCSLSLGAVDFLSFGGKSLFDWFDFVTGQIFLPVGGLLKCLFLGWFVPRQIVRDEFTNWGTVSRRFLDRKSTRLNSSHANISYAVFCLKKKSYAFICFN